MSEELFHLGKITIAIFNISWLNGQLWLGHDEVPSLSYNQLTVFEVFQITQYLWPVVDSYLQNVVMFCPLYLEKSLFSSLTSETLVSRITGFWSADIRVSAMSGWKPLSASEEITGSDLFSRWCTAGGFQFLSFLSTVQSWLEHCSVVQSVSGGEHSKVSVLVHSLGGLVELGVATL